MSNKQLRRFMEENGDKGRVWGSSSPQPSIKLSPSFEGKAKNEKSGLPNAGQTFAGDKKNTNDEDSAVDGKDEKDSQCAAVNRFELLNQSNEASSEESDEKPTEREQSSAKKGARKKKKGKKAAEMHTATEWDEDEELPAIPIRAVGSKEIFERDLFKLDSRLLRADNELNRMLGNVEGGGGSRSHHRRLAYDKIVKRKPGWPEVKNVGLEMVFDRADGPVMWFKYVHQMRYRNDQTKLWLANEHLDHTAVTAILADNPYHLDSLLIAADMLRTQEDYQVARDMIERGLFCCESVFATRFELSNFNHRIDYKIWENRAFFLLLHRHMRNLIDRRCFVTAFNIGKLLYRLDSVNDPLGMLLCLDTLAIKALQYHFVVQLYNTIKDSRLLERLPNFAYSVALAHFLIYNNNGDWGALIEAETMLEKAITHFPTVLLKILDKIDVQPDADVGGNEYLNALAHERESSGIKLLTSVYVEHSHDLWRNPEVLKWVERITHITISNFEENKDELEEWSKMRKSLYVGVPANVERHAWLWEVSRSGSWSLIDPVPPVATDAGYARPPVNTARGSLLSHLVYSAMPNYDADQEPRFPGEALGYVMNVMRRVLRNNGSEEEEQGRPEEHQ